MVRSRSVAAGGARPGGTGSRRVADLTGLALFFAGAAILVGLCWPQQAIVPAVAVNLLRLIFGAGAYILALLLMYAGAMYLVGFQSFALSSASYGSFVLFCVFITWRHLVVVRGPMPAPNDPGFHTVMNAGGLAGGEFATVALHLLGWWWTWLFLFMAALMGVVLVVERPFAEIFAAVFHHPARVTRAVAQQGVAVVRKRLPATSSTAKDEAKALAAREQPSPRSRWLGFLPVRQASEAVVPENGSGSEATAISPAKVPVQVRGRSASRRDSVPVEQTAFPTLQAEASDQESFRLPPITLLSEPPPPPKRTHQELAEKIRILEQTLEHFRIQANVVEVAHGPTVTRYEIQLAPGIRVAKIVSLADNLAMDLAAIDVRVEAPIPGKSAIGVEVPNAVPTLVTLRECLDTPEFWNAPSKLTFALGRDVAGMVRYADLAKMPHLLVAGSTNSGKSVCLNALIASLVYRAGPSELRFIMIDPKRVELSLWDGIPHLLHPVVKDIKQAAGILRAAIKEMERRYDLFARMQTRNIDGYNQRVAPDEKLPYVVIVVDELADLMMQAAAEVETSICRLAQLARATGIHLVIATQRPSVDVITGLIKANISSRIAFAVSSHVDSRTILDMNGAERLIGRGDMLFLPIDAAKPTRIQGCFLSEAETNALVEYLRNQEAPVYSMEPVDVAEGHSWEEAGDGDVDDELFERAVRLVVTTGQASTSMLQRRFKIGYTRAARIVDVMEERGIVGPPDGAKPREVLVTRAQVEEMFRQGD